MRGDLASGRPEGIAKELSSPYQWHKVSCLSVLSVARVMIAQWENECISVCVLPVARVQFPAVTENFKAGIFPWLIAHTWRGDGCRQGCHN